MKKLFTTTLILLSFGAWASDDFIIATGSEGGSYERLGKQIAASINKQGRKKDIEFDFEILNTNGSGENIELFNDGEAQAVIVQADALSVTPPSVNFKAKAAGLETVWWIYNTKNGFKDIEDIENNKKVSMVMVDGSGAVFTMQNFVAEDKGYQKNFDNAVYADDLYDAVDITCSGKTSAGKKIAGLLYVGASIPNEIRSDFKNCVSVGEATDGDFDDAKDVNGDELYKDCKINKNRYAPLKGSNSFTDEKTVCVNAMVVYTTDFEEKGANKVVKKGINKALRGK